MAFGELLDVHNFGRGYHSHFLHPPLSEDSELLDDVVSFLVVFLENQVVDAEGRVFKFTVINPVFFIIYLLNQLSDGRPLNLGQLVILEFLSQLREQLFFLVIRK